MNKLSISALSVAMAAALTASPAWAATTINYDSAPQGAHFRQGFSAPTCLITATNTVTCGPTQIAGIGNTDADLLLSVTYSATVQCRNHGGKVVEVKTQTRTATPAPDDTTELRNGTLYVAQFTSSPAPSADMFTALATCPNPNWTKELLGSPIVSSYTYTLTFEGFDDPFITVTGPSGS